VTSTKKALAAAAVVVVLVIVAVVAANRGSDGTSSANGTTPESTTTTEDGPLGSGATTSTAGGAGDPTTLPPDPNEGGVTGPTNPEGNSVMVPVKDLPLNVAIDKKSGLSDGDTVTVHVAAKSGQKIYGADVRLCQDGATIDNTADFAPTQGGQCVAAPLSASSDAFVEQAGADPFTSLDVPFRVGTGTSNYQMQDGTGVSITCGPGHPCVLVLKLQIDGGFGFESFDLSYG
jgi:hypothetical protein